MPSETSRPPLTLLLGPARSGKTLACIELYNASCAKTVLAVPSRGHQERMQRAVAASDPDADLSRIVPFGELIAALAEYRPPKSDPVRPLKERLVRRTLQRAILADLFRTTVTEEDYFHRMRETPGFIGALAEEIRELKLAGVSPDDLERGAEVAQARVDDSGFARKVAELARLYRGYEDFLEKHDLCDEEDLPRLAARAVARGARLPNEAKTLVLDGFYRLACVWRDLLSALARVGVTVMATLPYDPERPLLFASPGRTREALATEFSVGERLAGSASADRPGALRTLDRSLFGSAPPEPSTDSEAIPLTLFDAPNPYAEAEMVVRALRREHDLRETPWERCAVVLRSIGDYAPLLTAIGERYGVPFSFVQSRPVGASASVQALDALLRVYARGWQREDVIAFLRSSSVVGGLRADRLRLRAKRLGVREGRAAWGRLAESAVEKAPSSEPVNVAVAALQQMLERERAFTSAPQNTGDFVIALRAAAEGFGIARSSSAEEAVAYRSAMEAADQIAQRDALSVRGPVPFAEFTQELQLAWRGAVFGATPAKESVPVIEPYDVGQLDAQLVAVMGLTERVFPRRIMEDPFLRDEERLALRECAGLDLELRSERAEDERLLFYMATTAPSERLVLSFPRSSEESDTLPSFYLDEVKALFPHIPAEVRTLADVVPRAEECVSDHDRLLADCAQHSGAEPAASDAPGEEVAAVLATRERPPLPRLEQELLQAAYAADHRFSVTEIETYNRCPFQHFAKFGLKLRAESDGAGAADRGTLLHSTLRRALRASKQEGVDDSAEALKLRLEAELTACLNGAAIDARPHRREMMRRALRDGLEGFAERDVRCKETFRLTAEHFELSFGMEEREEPEEESEENSPEERRSERDYDLASTPRPLVLESPDGGSPVALCGAIDRVDLGEDGRTAMVIDYKSGSSVEWPDIKEGKSIQMPLYMLAVEQLFGMTAAVGCYDSPRDPGRRRFVRHDVVDRKRFEPIPTVEDGRVVKPVSAAEFEEAQRNAAAAVHRAVAGMRAIELRPTPGEHCRWCDYVDVCRTERDGVHDGEALTP